MPRSLLMDCEACGAKISRKSDSCPHCGHLDLWQRQKRRTERFLRPGNLIFIAVLLLISVYSYRLAYG